jgi:prolipoprotein diacylglyceryltransferase
LIAYGIWRIVIEMFRADYRGGADGALFTPSQWQSFAFIALGLVVLAVFIIKKMPIFLKDKGDSGKKEITK